MKISYNWLKEFVRIDLSPEKTGEFLTDTGLEVEKIEKVDEIQGGLEGLVIGKVENVVLHPDADKLKLTKVNIGSELLDIVCGAPNVKENQKVVIATVGTTLFPSGGEPFKIKKSKIRGYESFGMICAEDEIGLGEGHDGIMVLEDTVEIGTPANQYFNVESDYTIEIGLTPNRSDAMGHFGVARDLMAVLKHKNLLNHTAEICLPFVEDLDFSKATKALNITVENTQACPRYAGVLIENISVLPSPKWLQKRLKAIGLNPINNVVDVTNYVLHSLGQPLHAFDASKIPNHQVIVKTGVQSKFKTLDETERMIDEQDLMICNNHSAMCIAGVFGGLDSGVSSHTTSIMIESAYFNPVSVRKTAKRHGLNTDASFRFERGVDPNMVIYALKFAAKLILEVAGGQIASEIVDIYPTPIENTSIDFKFKSFAKLAGVNLPNSEIISILTFLDYNILSQNEESIKISIPPYRADVNREADIAEEILRIYGFNQVELPQKLNSSIITSTSINKDKIKNTTSNLLSDNGFHEIMSNSLTSSKYVAKFENEELSSQFNVPLLNPLSSELDTMRQSLLFGGLESIAYNINRQESDLKFYEFGKTYSKTEKYNESEKLALFITGNAILENWNQKEIPSDFYTIKKYAELVLKKLGIFHKTLSIQEHRSNLFSNAIEYTILNETVLKLGIVEDAVLKFCNVKKAVFYAEFDWTKTIQLYAKLNKIKFSEIPKFPSIRRDLSLMIDGKIEFSQIEKVGFKVNNKILNKIGLFDVYQGDKLPEGKKSYTVSFHFRDENKTLKDQDVSSIMDKIIDNLNKELNAEIR